MKSGIPWFRADLSVFAGYDVTSFSFRTGTYQRIQDPEPKVIGSAPTIGVGAVFSNPRDSERLSATIDLQFSQMSFDGSAQTYLGHNRFNEEYSWKFTRLRIPLGVKYILRPGTAVSYYTRVGYGFNMWLNGYMKASQVIHRPGMPTYTESFNYDLNDYSVGQFWFSVGTQINKFKVKGFLELRIEAIGDKSNPALVNQYGNPVIEPKSIGIQTYSLNLGITF